MSEFFAEATVVIRPDLTGFIGRLREQVKAAVTSVETRSRPAIRVRPALTKDFIGSLRAQANAAVLQAQRGVVPLQVGVAVSPIPIGALDAAIEKTESRTRSLKERLQETLAPPSRRHPLLEVSEQIRRAQAALRPDFGFDTGRVLRQSLSQTNAAREAANKLSERTIRQAATETAADRALARAKLSLASALNAEERSRLRLQFLRAAEKSIISAITLADMQKNQALRETAEQLGTQVRIQKLSTEALIQQERQTRRNIRSHEQLSRGAKATGLSFLGVRGATLAASQSFLIGAASVAIFAKTLQSASRFTDAINVLRATTGATASDLERVRAEARALGADIRLPAVTSADAAEAMVELAKAGLTVQESINGARGVLELAAAAAINNAQAVELTANALNAFQLSGRDATRVADVFANAANAAQGSIVDIGVAFQQAAAAGRQVGLSFEDTALFLTVLAKNGLRGSDAGTALRTALIRLARPTDAARERLNKLGVELRDAQGRLRPDVFIQIGEAVSKLPPAARDATIALIGGQDAFRAISILGRQSIESLLALRRQLREQGTAAELAAARTSGLRGSMEALSSTLETAGTRVGRALTPSLQGLVKETTNLAESLSNSEQLAQTFAGALNVVTISGRALKSTLDAASPSLNFIAKSADAAVNALGAETIIGAVAAYKLFPPALRRVSAATQAARSSLVAYGLAESRQTRSLRPLISGLGLLASTLNPVALGASAAGAAIFFLASRESEAEKITKRLRSELEKLVSSQQSIASLRAQRQDVSLGLNAAQLGVLEAQQAAAQARAALASSNAAKGTFERKRLELELAVALDNVKIAQINYNRALSDQLELAEKLRQEEENRRASIRQVISDLESLAKESANIGLAFKAPTQAAEFASLVFADRLRKQAKALRERNDAEGREEARRLELLGALSSRLEKLPDRKTIEVVINAENTKKALDELVKRFQTSGQEARAALFSAFLRGEVGADLLRRLGFFSRRISDSFERSMLNAGRQGGAALTKGASEGIDAGAARVESALARIVRRASGQLAGLQRQALEIAIAGGGPAEELANLRKQEQVARRRLEAAKRLQAAGKTGFAPVRRAQEELASIVTEIRAREEELAREAEEEASKAREARERRDQALLDALGFRRDLAREKIADAKLSEGLSDDIARTRELRRLVLEQIKTITERVKTEKLRIDAVRELRSILRDVGRELKELQRERQQQIQERIAESIELDIEFASLNENVQAEIRARQREIARLRRLQRETDRGSIEFKRLRNKIREQQKAIEDLRKQTKDRNDSFRRLTFEFLQRQQGFAFRLLGNLIPIDAQGLVGPRARQEAVVAGKLTGPRTAQQGAVVSKRTQSVIDTVDRTAAVAQAQVAGPTKGQAQVEIELLRRILAVLHEIRRGNAHPSAREARRRSGTLMDVM